MHGSLTPIYSVCVDPCLLYMWYKLRMLLYTLLNRTSNGFLRLDWLHNNELIKKGEERTSHNQLLIQPEKTYQGKYKCQVIYTNDSIGETVSAGQLLVYGKILVSKLL